MSSITVPCPSCAAPVKGERGRAARCGNIDCREKFTMPNFAALPAPAAPGAIVKSPPAAPVRSVSPPPPKPAPIVKSGAAEVKKPVASGNGLINAVRNIFAAPPAIIARQDFNELERVNDGGSWLDSLALDAGLPQLPDFVALLVLDMACGYYSQPFQSVFIRHAPGQSFRLIDTAENDNFIRAARAGRKPIIQGDAQEVHFHELEVSNWQCICKNTEFLTCRCSHKLSCSGRVKARNSNGDTVRCGHCGRSGIPAISTQSSTFGQSHIAKLR
jgi:hypothetical protein